MSEITITKPTGEVLLDIKRVTPEIGNGSDHPADQCRSHMSESGSLVGPYAGFNYYNPYPSDEELRRHGSMLRMVEAMVEKDIQRYRKHKAEEENNE